MLSGDNNYSYDLPAYTFGPSSIDSEDLGTIASDDISAPPSIDTRDVHPCNLFPDLDIRHRKRVLTRLFIFPGLHSLATTQNVLTVAGSLPHPVHTRRVQWLCATQPFVGLGE